MTEKDNHHKSALQVNDGIEQPDSTNKTAIDRFRKLKRKSLTADQYVEGVLSGDRTILSKAITLVESTNPAHHQLAQQIIEKCLPHSGKSIRIGITGVPGVGKSTFIEAIGKFLTGKDHKLAVLAIDPSSSRTRGSILGDKTRMEELSTDKNAFIRPSPSAGSLGGVARKTRESIILCEAAGFDVIFVETVGVGQSEIAVHSMVDFFLLLMLAGAGDELQGIKKGVLEVADAIAINKADGDNVMRAEMARKEYQAALHLLMPGSPNWSPPVLTCSALAMTGIDEVWATILDHRDKLTASGEFADKRKKQALDWMSFLLDEGLREWFFNDPDIRTALPQMRRDVESGSLSPTVAAAELLGRLKK